MTSTTRTRLALALLALAPASVWLAACGGSRSAGRPASQVSSSAGASATTTGATTTAVTNGANVPPAPAIAKPDADKDNDGNAPDEQFNATPFKFGHEANPSDARKIMALVRRYYAAALAGDGSRACAMLYTTMAESIPEVYGQPPGGPAYMLGAKTCAEGMHLLFRHFHAQLALEVPRLQVTHVRLEEHHGFALLRFGTLPEREISVSREGHTWKVEGIYDSELP